MRLTNRPCTEISKSINTLFQSLSSDIVNCFFLFLSVGLSFKTKGFLFIWLSSTISLFGDWFNYVATLDVIYESTDAALALSLYLTARMVPPFLISPIVGSIADHFDRRKLMVALPLLVSQQQTNKPTNKQNTTITITTNNQSTSFHDQIDLCIDIC
jgi:MFS family permease